METLVARYEADGENFLDGVPKHILPDLDYLGEFEGVAVYGLFARSQLYLVNAPSGTGLAAFVESRLRQLGRKPAAPTAVLLPAGDARTPSAEELAARAGIAIRPIPLKGRGSAPMAYQLEWAGKRVLFSGRIPVKITPESVAALVSDIGTSKARLQEYADSIEALRGLSPQLWLPATPIEGQNANLYDDDWERVLDANRDVTRFALSRVRLN